MLDVQDVRPLEIPEFLDILVTLSSFYNFAACKQTKSAKPVLRLLEAEVPAKRALIIKNLEAKMARMQMSEK